MKVNCEVCDCIINRKPSWLKKTNHIFCSQKCWGIWKSKNLCGKNSPWYGKHHTEESKQKIGIRNSHPMKQETKDKISNTEKGRTSPNRDKKLSKEHIEKICLSRKIYYLNRVNIPDILYLYNSLNFSIKYISTKYTVSSGYISKLLISNGIPIRTHRKGYFVNKGIFLELYFQRKQSIPKISLILNIPIGTLSRFCKKNNVHLRNIKERTSGFMNPRYGVVLTKEHRNKISVANTGRLIGDKNPSKRSDVKKKLKDVWSDTKYKERQHKKRMQFWSLKKNRDMMANRWTKNGLPIKNKIEEYIERLLISMYGDYYIYSGNGSIIVDNFFPDFISKDNKKIIEVFGDYWHNDIKRDLKYYQTVSGRKLIFRKKGYEILILWESEIKKNKNYLYNKIMNFTGNINII